MARSASSSASCTARPVWCSRRRRTRTGSASSPRASSRSAGRGSSSPSTSTTSIYVHIDKKKKFPATALLRALGYGTNSDILRLFFAIRELDLTKKRESRIDLREVVGAIIAEDITLAGEATDPEAPKLKTKKARAQRERDETELLVKEGDELTEEVYNRLRRSNIETVKVFASAT